VTLRCKQRHPPRLIDRWRIRPLPNFQIGLVTLRDFERCVQRHPGRRGRRSPSCESRVRLLYVLSGGNAVTANIVKRQCSFVTAVTFLALNGAPVPPRPQSSSWHHLGRGCAKSAERGPGASREPSLHSDDNGGGEDRSAHRPSAEEARGLSEITLAVVLDCASSAARRASSFLIVSSCC
jgi:hypothetical protein